MIRLIFFAAITIYFTSLSCNLHKRKPFEDVGYFEGIVEYEMVYESLHPELSSEDFASNSPDTKIQYFKNGNYVTESFQNDTMTSRSWFDKSSNRVYIQRTNWDTLYFYNAKNIDFEIEPFQVSIGDTILDHSTQKITQKLKGIDGSMYMKNESEFVYHIATDLPIDPKAYSDFLEFDFDQIMKEFPGIILKLEDSIAGIRKVTRTATRIERKPVDLDLSIDPSKVLKEI